LNFICQQGDDHVTVHPVGTAAVVVQVTGTNWPKPAYTLLATGLCRFKVDDILQESPYLVAKVTQLDKRSQDETGEMIVVFVP
jgi:ATP-dependent Lon protease